MLIFEQQVAQAGGRSETGRPSPIFVAVRFFVLGARWLFPTEIAIQLFYQLQKFLRFGQIGMVIHDLE
jgi:hypothetical protein